MCEAPKHPCSNCTAQNGYSLLLGSVQSGQTQLLWHFLKISAHPAHPVSFPNASFSKERSQLLIWVCVHARVYRCALHSHVHTLHFGFGVKVPYWNGRGPVHSTWLSSEPQRTSHLCFLVTGIYSSVNYIFFIWVLGIKRLYGKILIWVFSLAWDQLLLNTLSFSSTLRKKSHVEWSTPRYSECRETPCPGERILAYFLGRRHQLLPRPQDLTSSEPAGIAQNGSSLPLSSFQQTVANGFCGHWGRVWVWHG